MAHGGTIFLDEIGELNKNLQVKILRVIQDKTFTPVGGTEEIEVDVRVISATNRELEEEVKAGNFREDLYWRLNVIQIKLPPLRERVEDIPRLAMYFLEKYAKEQNKNITKFSAGAMALLENYDYPGNVRELENIVERAVALESGSVISPQSLPARLQAVTAPCQSPQISLPPDGIDLEKTIDEIEKTLLLQALERSGGVKTKAAELLKLSFRSFRYRLEKFGLE
jgi:two-component system response regulator PilR (NtrC family)